MDAENPAEVLACMIERQAADRNLTEVKSRNNGKVKDAKAELFECIDRLREEGRAHKPLVRAVLDAEKDFQETKATRTSERGAAKKRVKSALTQYDDIVQQAQQLDLFADAAE